MESYLFKIDSNYDVINFGGDQLISPNRKAIMAAATRLMTRLHRSTISAIKVKLKPIQFSS